MLKAGIAVFAAAVLIVTLTFLRYGTVAPCQMLKQDIVGQMAEEMFEIEAQEGADNLHETALALGDALTELALADKTAGWCMGGLWRLHVSGEDVFDSGDVLGNGED